LPSIATDYIVALHLKPPSYNARMALNHIDIEGGLRRLAERRIEDAMKEGKFDNLPGMGKPLDLEPMPADENARMTWWALRILKQNDFTPHEVQWRKEIDVLKLAIGKLTDESKLAGLVIRVNELVRKLNTLGTNAINIPMSPVDLETERSRLRDRVRCKSISS
jgi:Domain of unknown function (DUF1992)